MERFTTAQHATLLAVARAALMNCLVHELPPHQAAQQAVSAALVADAVQQDPALLADAACFVTLWQGKHGLLRGCRGEFTAHQPLLAAVAHMTLAAAFNDPRFEPLKPAEVQQVCIEISVLSPLAPVAPHAIEIGKHGLLLVLGNHRGLLLPEVPVEHHMQRESFLDALCVKAGLREGAWRDRATNLWSFETEAWEETR